MVADVPTEYWYKAGTANVDLVAKTVPLPPELSPDLILEFVVGQVGYPVAGDTFYIIPIDSPLAGRELKLFREGERMSRNTTFGWQYNIGTRRIDFYPELEALEKIVLETAGSTTFELDPPTVPEVTDLTFNYVQNNYSLFDLDNDRIWEGQNSAGVYGNVWRSFGQSDSAAFTGKVWVQMKYDNICAQRALIAFTNLNNGGDYKFDGGYRAGVYVKAGNIITVVDQDVESDQGTIAIGEYLRVFRDGTVYKCQKSVDQITWTDVYTYAYAFAGELFIRAAIDTYDYVLNDGSARSCSKLYYPQSFQPL
jgi:hypothetical protein